MTEPKLPIVYADLLNVASSEPEASLAYSFYLIAKKEGFNQASKLVGSSEVLRFSHLLQKVGIDVNSYRPLASVHPIRPN